MPFLLTIHSIVRWLIVLLAVFAIVRLALLWLRGSAFGRSERALLSAFSGLMDLQALLGLVYFFWTGMIMGVGFPIYRIEHMSLMLAAAVVAHLPSMWKKQSSQKRLRNSLLAVLAALVLVFLGVARLPGGWTR